MSGYDVDAEMQMMLRRVQHSINVRAELALDRIMPERIAERYERTRPRTAEEQLKASISALVDDWHDQFQLSMAILPAAIFATPEQNRALHQQYEEALAERRARRGYGL